MPMKHTIRLLAIVAIAPILAAGPPRPVQPDTVYITIKNTSEATWSLAYTKNSSDKGRLTGKLTVEIEGVDKAIAAAKNTVKLASGASADVTFTREGGRLYQVLTLVDGSGKGWATLECTADHAQDPFHFEWGKVFPNTQTTSADLDRFFPWKDGTVTIPKALLP